MNPSGRKSLLCPNCRKLISADEPRCPHCGLASPGSRWKNNPLTRGWGSGEKVIKVIIGVNIAFFILSFLVRPKMPGLGMNPLSFLSPTDDSLAVLGATGSWLTSLDTGWWRLISANYLHGSVLHIFFNMMALYQISPLITQLFGPYRYFSIYTIGGAGGFVISNLAGIPLTIGASAALCGLIGAAIYYGKSRGGVFGQAVYRQIGGWAIGILLFGFLVPGINNWAHIGGMVVGALCAFLLGYQERAAEGIRHRALAAVCLVGTAAVLLMSVGRGLLFLLYG